MSEDEFKQSLVAAIRRDDYDAVRQVIAGAGPFALDPYGNMLCMAVDRRRLNAVRALVDGGCDVDGPPGERGLPPLWSAVLNDDAEAVHLLCDLGANVNVAMRGGRSLLDLALDGLYAQASSALYARGARYERYAYEVEGAYWLDFVAPAACAIDSGHVDALSGLLDTGLEPNARAFLAGCGLASLVYRAASRGDLAALRLLLTAGADPTMIAENADDLGYNALHEAAERGHLHIVQALVEAGCSMSTVAGTGRTVLEIARWRRHEDLVAFLSARA